MTPGQILIVSDDSEFVRSSTSRWRMEKDPPTLTAVSSGASRQASSSGYEFVVVGPLRECTALPAGPAVHPDSVVCAVGDEESLDLVRAVRSDLAPSSGMSRMDQNFIFPGGRSVAPHGGGDARARSGNHEPFAKALWHSRQILAGGAPGDGQRAHLSSWKRRSDPALRGAFAGRIAGKTCERFTTWRCG